MTSSEAHGGARHSRRWLVRFVALAITLNVISWAVFVIFADRVTAPAWLGWVGTVVFTVYAPALALAYAVSYSDLPLVEFGFFVLTENILLAALIASVWTWLRRLRTWLSVSV